MPRLGDVGPGELAGCFDPIEAGHADVEQADVRAELPGQRDGFGAVGGLAEAFAIYGVIELRALPHLPDHGEDDIGFGFMRDALFEDNDVLMLFNPTLSGIEQDDQLGPAHLHPIRWFLPFR